MFLPGAMTDLILAGADPLDAVLVQAALMYLILGCVATNVEVIGLGLTRRLFTPDHRLVRLARTGEADGGRTPTRARPRREGRVRAPARPLATLGRMPGESAHPARLLAPPPPRTRRRGPGPGRRRPARPASRSRGPRSRARRGHRRPPLAPHRRRRRVRVGRRGRHPAGARPVRRQSHVLRGRALRRRPDRRLRPAGRRRAGPGVAGGDRTVRPPRPPQRCGRHGLAVATLAAVFALAVCRTAGVDGLAAAGAVRWPWRQSSP